MTNENFSMVRGDTFAFELVLSEVADESITSIYFTAKKKATDKEFIFQKGLGDGVTKIEENHYYVRVAPEDTYDVVAGKYYYDLQLGIENDIYTLLLGNLRIVQDVTVMTYEG